MLHVQILYCKADFDTLCNKFYLYTSATPLYCPVTSVWKRVLSVSGGIATAQLAIPAAPPANKIAPVDILSDPSGVN